MRCTPEAVGNWDGWDRRLERLRWSQFQIWKSGKSRSTARTRLFDNPIAGVPGPSHPGAAQEGSAGGRKGLRRGKGNPFQAGFDSSHAPATALGTIVDLLLYVCSIWPTSGGLLLLTSRPLATRTRASQG